MTDKKATKKDFVNLINSVVGENIMTENQLSQFLSEAQKINSTKGTEGLLDYVKKTTNAPASDNQLKGLANNIKKTGNPGSAVDYLMKEHLISEQHASKINKAIKPSKKSNKKK